MKPKLLLPLLLLISGLCVACGIELVELDPTWGPTGEGLQRDASSSDSPGPEPSESTGSFDTKPETSPEPPSGPEGPQPSEKTEPPPPEKPDAAEPSLVPEEPASPEQPSDGTDSSSQSCRVATDEELSLLYPIPLTETTMLVGNWDGQASNQPVQISLPPMWYAIPSSVYPNQAGRFAFLIGRNPSTPEASAPLTVYQAQGPCRLLQAQTASQKPPPRIVEPPQDTTCNANASASILLDVKGTLNPKQVNIFSSHPQYATVGEIIFSKRQGIPRYDLEISCHSPGRTHILLGAINLEPVSFRLTVQ